MNENQEPSDGSKSPRHTIGKFIVVTGVILFISGILLSLIMSVAIYLNNLNGIIVTTNSFTYQTPVTITTIGAITIIIGVLVLYATNQFSRDGIWSLKTGPYVK